MEGIRYFNTTKIKKSFFTETWSSMSWDEMPTPNGFILSPNDADFIFSSLLGNAWHWGCSGAINIYYDTNSYYVSKNFEIYKDIDSLIKNTTKINGQNGHVYNSLSNFWENVGYMHMTYPEVFDYFKIGTPRVKFINLINLNCRLVKFKSDWINIEENSEILEFWSRDGSFWIFLNDDFIVSVITNINSKE